VGRKAAASRRTPKKRSDAREEANFRGDRGPGEAAGARADASGIPGGDRNFAVLRAAIVPKLERCGAGRGTASLCGERESGRQGAAGRLGQSGKTKPRQAAAAYLSAGGKIQSRNASKTIWRVGIGAGGVSPFCQRQAEMGGRAGAAGDGEKEAEGRGEEKPAFHDSLEQRATRTGIGSDPLWEPDGLSRGAARTGERAGGGIPVWNGCEGAGVLGRSDAERVPRLRSEAGDCTGEMAAGAHRV